MYTFEKGDKRMNNNKNISEEEKEKRWDEIYSNNLCKENIRKQYDGWLESDENIIKVLDKCNTTILDLGSGVGIDTLHLIEKGYDVIAADFSSVALEKVKENIPEAKILKFNMKNGIPFEKDMFELVIANKSIHYFSKEETEKLILELYRIIKPSGVLAFIVNSTKDVNFGAGQGKQLEDNFYEVRGTTKRFFDKESLEMFFDCNYWEFISMNEKIVEDDRIKTVQLGSNKKNSKKTIWICVVKKK